MFFALLKLNINQCEDGIVGKHTINSDELYEGKILQVELISNNNWYYMH